MSSIQKVFKLLANENGRGGISNVAKHFGIRNWAVSKWKKSGVPAKRCPEIEELTKGKVTCEELRPDINWSILRRK